MKMKSLFIVLSCNLIAFTCMSCVHSKSINYATEKRLPKAQNYGMEILDPQDIKRPYKVIGTVEVNAGARFNIKDPIEELRREARKMGADALLSPNQTPIGIGVANTYNGTGGSTYNGHARDLFICKAVVWTD
jgi:hypothetical protein